MTKGLGGKRFIIAIVVVGAAFILIGYMLIQQQVMTDRFFSIVESKNFDNATSTNLIGAFEKVDKSNQTIFNIILPLLGAWVAAVITFYFGSRSLDKVQDANEKAQNIISKLALGKGGDIALEELLKLHPESKNVLTVKLDDSVIEVSIKAKIFGNVVVLGKNDKVLGVLYLSDLEKTQTSSTDKLKDVIEKIDDHITKTKWKKEGMENYAKLSYQDKISEARTKMEKVKGGERDVLGLVFEKDKPEAAINYQTLARYF